MLDEFQCPNCRGKTSEKWGLNGSNLGIRLMYWHFILNPGLALNELVLGQRAPEQLYICTSCPTPMVDRSYIQCPSCEVFHLSRIWSYKNAFGNWLGLICPSCGAQIPCLWNFTSRLLLALTAPIWWLPVKHYKTKWLEQQHERIKQNQTAYIDKTSNRPKTINYIRMGLYWGLFMFITFSIVFPAIFLLAYGCLDWSHYKSLAMTSACTGLFIWPLSGLCFGAIMQLIIDRKPTTILAPLLPKLLLYLGLIPTLALIFIIGYSLWAINAMSHNDKTPQKQALSICNLLLAVNPRWSSVYGLRGDLYQELDNKKDALDSYTKAIAAQPKDSYAYASRGNLYLDLKDYNKALDDSNVAISLNDDSLYAHYCRGQIYEHLKNYDKAIEDFTKTIAIDPKNGCYLERAYAYAELGQYSKALDDCNKELSLNPKSADAYYGRGSIYLKMGENKQAVADYTQAIAIDPKQGASYCRRAQAYKKLGLKELSEADNAMTNKLKYKDEEI